MLLAPHSRTNAQTEMSDPGVNVNGVIGDTISSNRGRPYRQLTTATTILIALRSRAFLGQ